MVLEGKEGRGKLKNFILHFCQILVFQIFLQKSFFFLKVVKISKLKGQLQGHTAMLAARLLKILAPLTPLMITYQSSLPRSPPSPPLAPAPLKFVHIFGKGVGTRAR